MNSAEKRHVISVLMANEAGSLSRVVGLFSARGFNIDSLNVAPTQNPAVSRLTLVTWCDDHLIEQINKQLNKLIDVIKLVEIAEEELIDREMMMVKILADKNTRDSYMQLAQTFRAQIVDICPSNLVVELTGSPRKLDAFINMIEPANIRELARTGLTGVAVTGSGKCLILED